MDGEIQLLESSTHYPQHEIIQTLIEVGKPVVVASDKHKTPSKVEKIAKSLGAHVYVPKNDLSQDKKKELGMGANDHELDAVASAKNAYNNLQKEITKIQRHADKTNFSEAKVAKVYFKKNKMPRPDEKSEEKSSSDNKQNQRNESNKQNEDKEKKRLRRKIENLQEKIQSQEEQISELENEKGSYRRKYRKIKNEKKQEILEKQELSKKDGKIKRKQTKINELERELEKAKIREKEYVKAIRHIYSGAEVLPLLESMAHVPDGIEKVVLKADSLEKEMYETEISEIYSRDDVKGVELKDFFVVTEYPEPNFEQVIKQYRESR